MSNRCDYCYYNDTCDHINECDDFYTLDREIEDKMLFDTIEEERQSYYEAWFQYISEDGFLF